MKHHPVAVGLLLCELVIVEEGTHHVTPVNCFNVRDLADFPDEISFCVLAWLTDASGELKTEVVIERLDNLEEAFRLDRRLTFPDRMADMRFLARVRKCYLPVAGVYQVSLIVDGELVALRKFRARVKGEQE